MLGSWKARWGVNRMRYKVCPGLRTLGSPGKDSPVLVSANYKMSFDRLRAALAGRDAWILVLDTQGINVWCAAGKGTFGTDELVARIEQHKLSEVVSHKTVIVPQLGAPGVSGYAVTKRTRFKVIFGPVLAADLPAFLDAGMRATREMRRVKFDLWDRAVLVPMELVGWGKYVLPLCLLLYFAGGWIYALPGLIALLAGAVLGPLLLPYLPGRSFSAKGAWTGLACAVAAAHAARLPGMPAAAWVLIITALSSFMTAYFTGCSTYTSLSGVRKELRFAVPLQGSAALIGLVLLFL
ncbi:MAG: mercury methylation corrinoid protein HgcA [Elusimicrobiota bacterium]